MRIDEIKITNYRGIREQQHVPLRGFSSIIGKNDSGKSIILHAIASLLDSKNHPIVESDFNDMSDPIEIECVVSEADFQATIEKKLKNKFKKDDGLEEFLNDIVQEESIGLAKSFSKPGKDTSDTKILMNAYDHDDFVDLYSKSDKELASLLEKYSVDVPVSGTGRNSRLEKIKFIKQYCADEEIPKKLTWIKDEYGISDLLPGVELFQSDYGIEADTKFKTTSVSEIQDFFVKETSEESGRLSVIEEEIKKNMYREAESIKSYMKEYAAALEDVEISPLVSWKDAIKGVNVSFQFAGDAKLIQMSHKGAGYRRLFMVARFRYLADKNKGKNVIYLIEEPETFLHPAAQHDLLSSFNDLAEESQVVITTHSPVFAGSTDTESIILCTKDKQSEYQCVDEDEFEFIAKIVDELGIKPHHNLVDQFESIVFLESHHDIDFYDLLCNTLFGKGIKDRDDILCLPYGGSSVDSFVNIEYFDKSNRKLFMILDSDKHRPDHVTEKQKERCADFKAKKNCNGYLLEKACIENYYHPRAIERVYGLAGQSFDFFDDEENVVETIKAYVSQNSKVQIKEKNNFDIYNEMTEDEWREVVEPNLINFLKDIVS